MIYTAKFPGHYLTGYAIVEAANKKVATNILQNKLEYEGLFVKPEHITLTPFNKKVLIQFDGDY